MTPKDEKALALILMTAALIFCPWLATLLAARGMVGLAKICLRGITKILKIDNHPWTKNANNVLNIIEAGLDAAIELVKSACDYAADLLRKVYGAGSSIVRKAWSGLLSAADWLRGRRPAFA